MNMEKLWDILSKADVLDLLIEDFFETYADFETLRHDATHRPEILTAKVAAISEFSGQVKRGINELCEGGVHQTCTDVSATL